MVLTPIHGFRCLSSNLSRLFTFQIPMKNFKMENTIEFAPAIPLSEPPDIQKRIQELREYLDPTHVNYQREEQHVNVEAAVKLYEEGKINGEEHIYIMDGKVVSREETFRQKAFSWMEDSTNSP
jgi:hypothetical protein